MATWVVDNAGDLAHLEAPDRRDLARARARRAAEKSAENRQETSGETLTDSLSRLVGTHRRRARIRARHRSRAGGRPARGDRRAGRRDRAGRQVPDAARHHRLREELHDRQRDRAGEPPDAGARAQQEPGRAARGRVPRAVPEEPGRVLRLLLRLLPARGVPPVDRHVHREGQLDQRRDRPAAPLGHERAALPARRDHRRVGVARSTASVRPRCTRSSC